METKNVKLLAALLVASAGCFTGGYYYAKSTTVKTIKTQDSGWRFVNVQYESRRGKVHEVRVYRNEFESIAKIMELSDDLGHIRDPDVKKRQEKEDNDLNTQ